MGSRPPVLGAPVLAVLASHHGVRVLSSLCRDAGDAEGAGRCQRQ